MKLLLPLLLAEFVTNREPWRWGGGYSKLVRPFLEELLHFWKERFEMDWIDVWPKD